MSIELLLLIAAVLVLLSILASKVSARIGIPALLLFLVIGMLAGSDGPGGIYFDNPWLAQLLGSTALAYILFAGGLQTEWRVVRPVAAPALALASIGVVLTALAVGIFAHYLIGFSWLEGLLLGAIVSSTDAAAVFSILRSRSTRLKGNLEPLLELESGSNDPMAVFLTIAFTNLLRMPDTPLISIFPLFILQFGLGAVIGWLLGNAAVRFINRLNLSDDGLYPVLTTAIVILVYGLVAALGGNGFLAVYIAGLILGNSSFIHKKSLTNFHDGLTWIMQIMMFLILGLQVFPSRLTAVIDVGLFVALFLMLVGRPLSVFITLIPFKFSFREKSIISWVGLRGAAPIILATFPLLANLPEASNLFHLVFFVVLVSVLLQGSSLPLVGNWLGLNASISPQVEEMPLPERFTSLYNGQIIEISIPRGSKAHNQRIMDLSLPKNSLVVLIQRDASFIIPRGDVSLRAGDRVLLATDTESLPTAQAILEGLEPTNMPSKV
jgi:potassium/hydrogen antiporter